MLRDAATVYLKEMREVLRDRKTLVFMILLPLLFAPLIGHVTAKFIENAQDKAMTQSLPYALFENAPAPGLADALSSKDGLSRVDLASVDEIPEAIDDGRIKFALVVDPLDADRIAVAVHYDNTPVFGGVKRRVGPVIDGYNELVVADRLDALGARDAAARQAVLQPVELQLNGLATERQVVGERLGGMLPYLLIIFCFMGALYPAIDLAAGEKERGTLETLLLAPISRRSIVLGKFGVVFTTGTVSAALGTASIGTWLLTRVSSDGGGIGAALSGVGPAEFVLIGALFVPIAAVFAALLLSISVYAKSFKEAQSYIAPLNMLVILPAFLGLLPGVEMDWRWAMVPISNVTLAIKEIVKGTLDLPLLVLIFASSLALAAAMLGFCVRWFSRENVLFRQ